MIDGSNVIDNSQRVSSAPEDMTGGSSAQMRTEGRLDGMTVEIEKDPIAAVQDAAEELTFVRDNSRKTKLAERRQKAHVEALMVEKAQAMYDLLVKFHNADFEAKKRIYEDCRRRKVDSSKQLLNSLKELGGHPSSNYAFLIKTAQEETDPKQKALLQEAAEELFRESSREILASLNSVEVARGSDLGDGVYLSEAYSELSGNGDDPLKMLDFIAGKFGDDRINEGVDFMLKSLGADISSPLSSQEPVVLEFVGKNLSVVRSLNSATQVMSRFTGRIDSAHGVKAAVSPTRVLTGLLNLSKQRYINPTSIRDLYGDVAKQNPEVEVLLAQDLLNSVRNLSTDLFDKDDARLRIVQSMEQLIDGLVDAEDAWLENGGN